MELKKLTEVTMNLLDIKDIKELPNAILSTCRENKTNVFLEFEHIVEDLNTDWLQQIYQYHLADREEKKQDYTPKSLADFMGKLAGDSEVIIDMCAGSGALTIQKWKRNKNIEFILYEYDENVIPILIFNMMLRNIECVIYHADVLQDEVYHVYKIKKGNKYGIFEEVR